MNVNKKAQNVIKPGARLFILISFVFALATFFFDITVGFMELAVVALLAIYSLVNTRRQQKELIKFVENVAYNSDSAKNNTLMSFPLPIVVFNMQDCRVIWANQLFFELFGENKPSFGGVLTDMVPGFNYQWLAEGKTQYPGLVKLDNRKYHLFGNVVRGKDYEQTKSYMGITYLVDITEYDNIKLQFEEQRPVILIIIADNYDEVVKNMTDSGKTEIQGKLDDLVEKWCAGRGGIIRRFDRDRYFFITDSLHYQEIKNSKFSVLETAHEIRNHQGVHMTLSIGVGTDGKNYEETYSFAHLASEMALSRGGDQAAIKNNNSFEFFGGRGMEVETRTKVKSRVTANAIAELMRDSTQIFVMGHKQSDLDCIGAAIGIACIGRKLKRNVKIVVDPEENVAQKLIVYMQTTPEYKDSFITPEDAILAATSRTLLIVVDTNRPEQVQSLQLLESSNRIAVIDHHRRAANYINNATLIFQEPYASSACELIAEMMEELVDHADITRAEADAVLSGIVLDTKHFSIRTGERTFDAAAFLRRLGADTAQVKRFLQGDIEENVAKFKILQRASLYRDAIAIAVCEESQERVVAARAADEMLNISGVDASIVIYPTDKGGVTASARSIGEINVQLLLEGLGGGGNASAAGVQMENITIKEAAVSVLKVIDDYLNE